jgi:hypothetical protein
VATPDTWKRRDGTEVKLVDMTDDHLNNTIFMFDRRGMWAFRADLKHTLLLFNSERYLAQASEHAADAVLREGDCVAERLEQAGIGFAETLRLMCWLPMYDALLAERDRRVQEGRWQCVAPMHAQYDVMARRHEAALYACSVNDDLTLAGKGD